MTKTDTNEIQPLNDLKAYLDKYDMYLENNFANSLAHLTISFRTKKYNKVEFFRSYTFWNFLCKLYSKFQVHLLVATDLFGNNVMS